MTKRGTTRSAKKKNGSFFINIPMKLAREVGLKEEDSFKFVRRGNMIIMKPRNGSDFF